MIRPALQLGLAAFAAGAAACSLADLSGLSVGTGAASTGAGGASTASTTGSSGGGGEGATTAVTGTTTISASSSVGGGGGDGGAGGGTGGEAGSGGLGGGDGGGGGGGSPEPCRAGQICSFVETFDAELDPPAWGHFGSCDREVDGGRWAIDAFVDDTGFCGEYSLDYFDVRGSMLTIALPETTVGAIGAMTYVKLEEGEGLPAVAIRQHGGRMETESGLSVFDEGPYDVDEHRFWAIGEDAGEIVFLVRAVTPGADWVELRRVPSEVDASDLRVVIGIGTYEPLAAPGRGLFDCLNVDPDDCPP